MINTSNTVKPKSETLYKTEDVSDKVKIRQKNIENAQKLLDKYGYFGGKRLLGKNENGTEVWISFKATDKTIEIDCTHDMWSVMPENGGEYAAERASYFLTKPISKETTFSYYDGDRGNVRRHGMITKNTLLHLDRIIDECERFTRSNQTPPRDIYRLLAWNIFSSTHNDSYTYPATNWDFCADIQGYTSPEGYYFTGQI
jgi:hypothetical protein